MVEIHLNSMLHYILRKWTGRVPHQYFFNGACETTMDQFNKKNLEPMT